MKISNEASFLRSLREAQRRCSDLTVPLREIGLDWLEANRETFASQGQGSWPDYADRRTNRDPRTGRFRSPNAGYMAQKLRRWGFVYPMLRASGKLERSVTEKGAPGQIFRIIDGKSIELGTSITSSKGANYPKFLDEGTRKMKARPFLKIPENRFPKWKAFLERYIAEQLKAA